jgi:NADH oxidase (H2O2-forming)
LSRMALHTINNLNGEALNGVESETNFELPFNKNFDYCTVEDKKPNERSKSMQKRDVVIIGGGPAGRVIVHALQAQNSGMSVTLIKDEAINVNRCAVPYGIPQDKPIGKFQIPNQLVTDFGAELIVDHAVKIDTQQKQVHTRKDQKYGYKHLVLATGSRPLLPPIPGVKLAGVTTVRSLRDLDSLRRFAAKGQKAVIVGGGYIGVEVAVVLRQMGLEVFVVEMLPQILTVTTEPEFITDIEKTLTEKGVHILSNCRVAEFQSQNGGGVQVGLAGGDILSADFVVLSVGVVPNIELAAEAGIQTSALGIMTDPYLSTSAAGVYAAGDCAEKKSYITQKPIRGEFGTNAVFMAKIVAQNIMGHNKAFPGIINANATTVYDWCIGSSGLTEKMAVDAGLNVVSGYSEVLDKYPMMGGATPVHTKLVFERDTQRLIGGSVMRKGHGATQNVDFISFAIQMGATMDNLLGYQYATHPELAAKPSDNTYVFAAQNAHGKL